MIADIGLYELPYIIRPIHISLANVIFSITESILGYVNSRLYIIIIMNIHSCGPLQRLSTMSTFLRTLPHLSPTGWGSLTDLLYPCPSGTPRRSSPIRTRTMTSLRCNDLTALYPCMTNNIKPNTHRRRRRDETVELRRVGGVYINSQLTHDDCRRIRRCERSRQP